VILNESFVQTLIGIGIPGILEKFIIILGMEYWDCFEIFLDRNWFSKWVFERMEAQNSL